MMMLRGETGLSSSIASCINTFRDIKTAISPIVSKYDRLNWDVNDGKWYLCRRFILIGEDDLSMKQVTSRKQNFEVRMPVVYNDGMVETHPYRVQLYGCQDRMDDVLLWLSTAHIDHYWVLDTITGTCTFDFSKQEDALLFSMTWR